MKRTWEQLKYEFIRLCEKNNETDCWNWTGSKCTKGYGMIFFRRRFASHRLSYLLFVGKIPDGMFVCHHCDNPSCVNPAHLFLGTAKDNIQDAIKKNRLCIGERNHMTVLSNKQVKQIFSLAQSGLSQTKIAEKFGVGQPHISKILNNKRRKYVYELDQSRFS